MSGHESKLRAAHREISAEYLDGAERRNAAVIEHFKIGARRPWCRRVWETAVKLCGGRQRTAVGRLFVNDSTVSNGVNEGRLSVENLVLMLIELEPAGWKLPELPPHVEMAREGFVEAMSYAREPKVKPAERHPPSLDDLAALVALLADKEWFKLDAQREVARLSGDGECSRRLDERLAVVARRVCQSASRRSNTTIERNSQQLRELRRTWADHWAECRCAVPFTWAEMP